MAPSLYKKDVLTLGDLSVAEVNSVASRAQWIKSHGEDFDALTPLKGMSVGVILQKASLRTRVSFEVGIKRLGANSVIMPGSDNAFSRHESPEDTVRVLEKYLDALVIRTYSDDLLTTCARASKAPIINALSDGHHPCQGLADFLTIRESLGETAGLKLVFLGDGSSNMAHTYLDMGALGAMDTIIATPRQFLPDAKVLSRAQDIASRTGGSILITDDVQCAVKNADIVITDTWASMGQEDEHEHRVSLMSPYQVNEGIMQAARASAIFMHCLPAHRGEEVTDAVIDSPHSCVFDQAENRLYAQMALLWLILDPNL